MKVALYARVSTEKQADKDLSIPDQLRQMREYCQKHSYEVYNEYIEGRTATEDRRPVFQEMIAEAMQKNPPFNMVLTLTTSRFFRNATQARIYKHNLSRRGIKVIAIHQEVSDDP
ncbi:unnamed protein product, partial [marine sediment metagenome]